MYSLLGSHDVERIRTMMGGSLEKTRLAHTLLFGLPGVPAIYYGDEIGLEGGRDPDCRRAFPWDEKQWQRGLQEHIRQLIQIRQAYPALRRGKITFPEIEQVIGGIAWLRSLPSNHTILVAANPTATQQKLTISGIEGIPEEGDFANLLDETRPCRCEQGNLIIPMAAWGGGIFVLPA
jgi:glycosidase